MEKLVKKIISIDYHRNGIFGLPFRSVIFESTAGRMLGILIDDSDIGAVGCFVLDIDKLNDNNISQTAADLSAASVAFAVATDAAQAYAIAQATAMRKEE